MWSDVCCLGILRKQKNEIGDIEKVISYDNEIFCNEKSIRYSEFYQAQAVGMKPELILEVMLADYNKEKFIKYQNEEYTVLKTYKISTERIELTLVRGINNGST